MRILQCSIDNFGKLSNVSIDFTEGCNTFCEENGWGKSTLAAFIRVMFYGFENEKKRNASNERVKYKPWQSGNYGGEIRFEAAGQRYSLRRNFGSKAAEDTFYLADLQTNLESRDYSENIGEELFQIDGASFARTVFIAQNDCGTQTTDSINAKIGNLADNTDDINNYETVQKKLTDLLNSMTPDRSTGSLKKLKNQIAELENGIRKAGDVEEQIDSIRRLRNSACEKLEENRQNREALEERQRLASRNRDLAAKREIYNKIYETFEDRKAALTNMRAQFPGELPTAESLQQLQQYLSEWNRANGARTALTEQEKRMLQTDAAAFSRGVPEQAELEETKRQIHLLKQTEAESAGLQFSYEEEDTYRRLTDYFAEELPEETAIVSYKREWAIAEKKRGELETRQNSLQYRMDRENDAWAASLKNKKMLLVCFILASALMWIAGAAIFLMGNVLPAAVCTGVAALCTLTWIVFLGKTNRAKQPNYSEGVRDLQAEIDAEYEEIIATEGQIQRFLEDFDYLFDAYMVQEDLSDLLANVKRFHELDDKCRRLSLAQQSETLEIRDAIQTFFDTFSYEREERADRFELQLQCLKNQIAEYTGLLDKQDKNDENSRLAARYSQKLQTMFLQYGEQVSDTAEGYTQGINRITERYHAYRSCLAEYDKALSEKQTFEETVDVAAFRGLPEITDNLEELAERLNRLLYEADIVADSIAGCDRQLEELQDKWEHTEQDKQLLEENRQALEINSRRYELLKLTKTCLEEAKQSFTAEYMEPVMSGFRKYYGILTGQEATRFSIDANTKLSVLEQNMPREIDALSAGRQDLIYLCMRMALVEAMYKGEKPFIVLDDSFVNLDDATMNGARVFLQKLGESYQVLYFTCSESRL